MSILISSARNGQIQNEQRRGYKIKITSLSKMVKSSPVTGLECPRGFQEIKVKVKQSRYRPGVAQRVPGN